ncbi:PREDICTED: uncharacterized protein LOC106309150 [Brassica oleracea var. oleracea]|uniref:uncharacterized protein LOC106309150 n=1 Tax=Brassica oleracea var. oleracea TaxID=109376 RepID=UPI0006A73A6B|nr:PREDICTED: uncharacterized protein LOC106309150 [Brassica oleracea var. oleracea]
MVSMIIGDWTREYRLKGENLWAVDENNASSSTWKSGKWQSLGILAPRELQIPNTATVSDACNRAGWIFPGARSEAAEELLIYLTYLQLPSLSTIEDTYVWVVDNEELTDFSSRKTWNVLRNRGQTQLWTKNIWFKGHVPKHAFTAWIAHQVSSL